MSGNPLFLVVILGLPLLVGSAFLRLIGISFRKDRIGYFAWAFMSGGLMMSLLLYVALLVGLRSLPWLAGGCVILGILGIVKTHRPADTAAQCRQRQGHAVEQASFAVVVAGLFLLTCYDMTEANTGAMVSHDESYIWAAKAKVLFVARGFGEGYRELMQTHSIVHHRDYPMLNPLVQLWTFLFAGEMLHYENRVAIQGFFLALILALAAALARVARPALAALLLFLLWSSPASQWLLGFAYSDHLVALGLLVVMDAWWRYQQTGERCWWRLAVTALTFMAWSKNEGLMLAAVVASTLSATAFWNRRHSRIPGGREWAWLAMPFLVVASHLAMNALHDFDNDLMDGFIARLGEQLAANSLQVAGHFAESMFLDPSATQLFLAFFPVFLVLFPRRATGHGLGSFAVVFAVALLLHFLVYASTPHRLGWHLATSSSRVFFQLMPALALWIAAAAARTLRWMGPPAQDAG